MKPFITLALLVTTLFFFVCRENSTSPSSPTEFSLTIAVVDTQGAPVSNLRVVGGSLLSAGNFGGLGVQPWVNLVYRTSLRAVDTLTESLLFQDSILMVFADVDAGNPSAWLGNTSANGRLTLSDINRFPGILGLPPIPETSSQGPTPVAEFSIIDTALFIFVDTVTNRSQAERRVIGKGFNNLNVVWKPGAPAEQNPTTRFPDARGGGPMARKGIDRRWAGIAMTSGQAATAIGFDILTPAKVKLSVLQLDGSNPVSLIDSRLAAGSYRVIWSTQQPIAVSIHAGSEKPASEIEGLDWKLYQNYPNPYN